MMDSAAYNLDTQDNVKAEVAEDPVKVKTLDDWIGAASEGVKIICFKNKQRCHGFLTIKAALRPHRQGMQRDALRHLLGVVAARLNRDPEKLSRLSVKKFAKLVTKVESDWGLPWKPKSSNGTAGRIEKTIAHQLTVSLDPPQAILDGRPYSLLHDGAMFVNKLLNASGDWIAGPKLDIGRADRIFKALPSPIRELIESARFKGYRIQLAKLASQRQK